MSPRQILLSVAVLGFIGAIILGLSPRNVNDGSGDSNHCGSIFKPEKSAGEISDSIAGTDINGECESKLSSSKPYMFGAFGLAGIAFIVAFVASNETKETV